VFTTPLPRNGRCYSHRFATVYTPHYSERMSYCCPVEMGQFGSYHHISSSSSYHHCVRPFRCRATSPEGVHVIVFELSKVLPILKLTDKPCRHMGKWRCNSFEWRLADSVYDLKVCDDCIYCGVAPKSRIIERPLLVNGYAHVATS
jgi:hypothetical protein